MDVDDRVDRRGVEGGGQGFIIHSRTAHLPDNVYTTFRKHTAGTAARTKYFTKILYGGRGVLTIAFSTNSKGLRKNVNNPFFSISLSFSVFSILPCLNQRKGRYKLDDSLP